MEIAICLCCYALGILSGMQINRKSKLSIPMAKSTKAYMVLKGKAQDNVFWTTGGEYRTDWYELLFESDDEETVQKYWALKQYLHK